MQILNQGETTASLRRVFFILLDAATGQVKQTGKAGTLAGFITKTDGVTTAKAGSFVELDSTNAPGLYYYEATAEELDTAGPIVFSFTCVGCLDRTIEAYVGKTNTTVASEIRGSDSDDLKDLSDQLDDIEGAGFSTVTDSLKPIRDKIG